MANPLEFLTQLNQVKDGLEKTAADFDASILLNAIVGTISKYVLTTMLNAGPSPDLAEVLGVTDAQARKLYIVILNSALRRNETWKTNPTLPEFLPNTPSESVNTPSELLTQ